MSKNNAFGSANGDSAQGQTDENDEVVEVLPRLSQVRLDTSTRNDNYWRLLRSWDHYTVPLELVKATLRSDGYYFVTNSTFDDLLPLAHRSQIGLICYEQLEDEELEMFLKARKRKIPNGCGRPGFIKLLYQADLKRRFDECFHKLAPEIQDHIAVHYITSFPQGLKHPSPPPLALTSKKMMNQVMPRFYEHGSFHIEVMHRKKMVAFGPRTDHFLSRVTPKDFSRIRILEIGNNRASDMNQTWIKSYDVRVALRPKDRNFDLEFPNPLVSVGSRTAQTKRDALEEELRDVIQKVLDRKPPENTINLHDLMKLKTILSKNWQKRFI